MGGSYGECVGNPGGPCCHWIVVRAGPWRVIAESGFPDYRDMDWKQLLAWGFRLIGVGVALLLVLVLWLTYRPKKGAKGPDSLASAALQSELLPAAAVSVLEDRLVSDRTLLATIIEMCQVGTLQFEGVGTGSGFRYRLTQRGPAQFDWERLICESLPSRAMTVQELRDLMNGQKDAIGDELGEYLQRRGLFP